MIGFGRCRRRDGFHPVAEVVRTGHEQCGQRAGHRHAHAQQHGSRRAPSSADAANQLKGIRKTDQEQ